MNVCKLASYITLKGHSDWKHDSFFHERLVAPPNYSTFLFYEPCFIFYFFWLYRCNTFRNTVIIIEEESGCFGFRVKDFETITANSVV